MMISERKEKVGMKEIAEAAGVSVMTVSAALSGNGRVSEERKREIVELARRMGYRGNAAARLLKSKRVNDLGLLIFEREELIRENAGFMDMTVQFMKECLRNGIHFQMEWFDCYKDKENLPQLLTNGLAGGLLIAGAPANAARQFIDQELTLPYVALGEPGPCSVRIEFDDALRQSIYYLASLGHSNIGMINGPSEVTTFRKARKVFESTLSELSLLQPDTFYLETRPAEDFQNDISRHLKTFLELPERPTALLMHSGLYTKAFISGLFRNGLRVPEDVSIVCSETVDWEVTKFVPPITAIEHSFSELVSAGIHMVRELMAGRKPAREAVSVSAVFTKRETVCPPGKI